MNIAADTRLVLYVGRLDPVKGVADLLEAAARLVPTESRLQVVCVGTGVVERLLRARAARPDLEHHVRFVGQGSPAEIARWLAAADLLCLPSFSEGCPNVVVEALACGRPVVATAVGGTPELVDAACGILITPNNPSALADALRRALARPWDEKKIAERYGRSWDDVAAETFDVCRSVLRGR